MPSPDIRLTQAARLAEIGVAEALGYGPERFTEFLAAIPEAPTDLVEGEYAVLEVPGVPLTKLCALAQVDYFGSDFTIEQFDLHHADAIASRWVIMRDGRENHGRTPADCRVEFCRRGRRALTVYQGILAFVQDPTLIEERVHSMDLPGSAFRGYVGRCPFLSVRNGQAQLRWRWDGDAFPDCGSAPRRK